MISLIVAMSQNQVIGSNGKLPWEGMLQSDMAFFRSTTNYSTVIMGRKTYESIGHPLKNRRNIVITRDKSYEAPGCTVFHTLEDALKSTNQGGKVFIIGGAELYSQALNIVDRMYVTLVEHDFQGDTYFPEFDANQWEIVSDVQGPSVALSHRFLTYQRVRK